MQVFNAFFKIAWKKKATSLVYITIFVAIMIILTFTAQNNIQSSFTAQSLSVYIEDYDNSVASNGLVQYLSGIHSVIQEKMDQSALADQIYYREIAYVLEIPEGFEEELISGKIDNLLVDVKVPGSNSGYYVDAQIREYLQCLQMNLAGGFSVEEAVTNTQNAIASVPEVQMVTFQEKQNPKATTLFYYYQYMAYVFVLVSMTGLSPILIKLNQHEIKARMNCSAYPFSKQVSEIILGCIVFGVMFWALFMILSIVIFGKVVFEVNALYAALNSFLFMLFSLGVAIILSTFQVEDSVINMIANITSLASSFLCGVFVPQSILSENVLRVGKFLPAYWYVCNNNMLAGFGNRIFDSHIYWRNIGVMSLFVFVIFLAAVGMAKRRHVTL